MHKIMFLIIMWYPLYRGIKGTVELVQYWIAQNDEKRLINDGITGKHLRRPE